MKKFDNLYAQIIEEQIAKDLDKFKDFKVLTQDVILEEVISEGIGDWFSWIKDALGFVKDLAGKATKYFKMGYDAIKSFCTKLFNMTWVKSALQKLGLKDDFVLKLVKVVKGCLIAVPIAKVGYGVYKGVKNDIKEHDIKVLIDKEKFNQESAKIFSKESLTKKVFFILKSGSINLVKETVLALPLIFKCIFSYAIVEGFEEGFSKPNKIEASLEKMEKTGIEMANTKGYTEEEALKVIAKNYNPDDPNTDDLTDWLSKSYLLQHGKYENLGTKKMENLQYFHRNEADKGKMLHNDEGSAWVGGAKSYRYFDEKQGKYVDQELSDDPMEAARRLSNMPGMNIPGAPGVGAAFAF